MFSVFVCKASKAVLSAVGRGSSLPGAVSLKLSPHALSRIQLPEKVIAVTGSNGKTSTTELIRKLAEKAGMKVVCNSEGSNQIQGVATALLSSCRGNRVDADAAVLESDERFCQYTFKQFSLDAIVVNNLFRDQMTRNGHPEFVKKELMKGLPESSMLILNADDPMSASLAEGRKDVKWFGVEKWAFCEEPGTGHAYDDGAFCPICHSRMKYEYRIQSHLGSFRCTGCGFSRPAPDHAVTGISDGSFVLDGRYSVKPEALNVMFAENIAAAFTAGVEVLGIDPEKAAGYLNDIQLENKKLRRIRKYRVGSRDVTFMLCKHENSIAYNATFESITDPAGGDVTVVVIVDQLSRKYTANDMSWLWDLDFGFFRRENVKKVILAGRFANDLASTALLSGVDNGKIIVDTSLPDMMNDIRNNAEGRVYVTTCFTDAPKFDALCRKEASA
ncbi:MAG: MurT ligase domain-containing protein [Oscillospiraceae bacterium]